MPDTTTLKTRSDKQVSKSTVETADDPFYSPENMRALDESFRQLREGKVVVKTLDELKAMED